MLIIIFFKRSSNSASVNIFKSYSGAWKDSTSFNSSPWEMEAKGLGVHDSLNCMINVKCWSQPELHWTFVKTNNETEGLYIMGFIPWDMTSLHKEMCCGLHQKALAYSWNRKLVTNTWVRQAFASMLVIIHLGGQQRQMAMFLVSLAAKISQIWLVEMTLKRNKFHYCWQTESWCLD